jgi:hypothetical protein
MLSLYPTPHYTPRSHTVGRIIACIILDRVIAFLVFVSLWLFSFCIYIVYLGSVFYLSSLIDRLVEKFVTLVYVAFCGRGSNTFSPNYSYICR